MEDASISAPKDVQQLLQSWIYIASRYATAHQAEAATLRGRHMYIGAPSVVLSTVVGTSIFAAIQEAAQSFALKAFLATLSMTAAALAALVTFFGLSERASAHRLAAEGYADICRRLEVLQTSITAMPPRDWRNILDGYSQQLEGIGRRADIPKSMLVEKKVEVRHFDRVAQGPAPWGDERTATVWEPSLRRAGFPQELDRLYEQAQER